MPHSEPAPVPRATGDPGERTLVEVRAAIELVCRGHARRVALAGLDRPEAIAGIGASLAGRAGVRFSLERSAAGLTSIVIWADDGDERR